MLGPLWREDLFGKPVKEKPRAFGGGPYAGFRVEIHQYASPAYRLTTPLLCPFHAALTCAETLPQSGGKHVYSPLHLQPPAAGLAHAAQAQAPPQDVVAVGARPGSGKGLRGRVLGAARREGRREGEPAGQSHRQAAVGAGARWRCRPTRQGRAGHEERAG